LNPILLFIIDIALLSDLQRFADLLSNFACERYIKSKNNNESPISNEIGSEMIASLAISFVRNVAFVCYRPL